MRATTVAETTPRPSIARRILRSRISSAVAAAVVTASVAGGVAYAAIEPIDAEGTIHGCYNPASGALKLLTMPACPTKGYTTAIAWSYVQWGRLPELRGAMNAIQPVILVILGQALLAAPV